MAKKSRQRSQTDDPKGKRREADAVIGMEREKIRGLIKTRKYRAEVDPRTRRPKR